MSLAGPRAKRKIRRTAQRFSYLLMPAHAGLPLTEIEVFPPVPAFLGRGNPRTSIFLSGTCDRDEASSPSVNFLATQRTLAMGEFPRFRRWDRNR
jgi:hypothetical protein